MLWLCLYLPRLPLEALTVTGETAAVCARHGSRRWIVASADARIAAGMDCSLAQSLVPELRLLERSVEAEQQALESVADCAYRYGQPVSLALREAAGAYGLPVHAVWVEIGASLRLFGGRAALLERLREELAPLACCYRLALAPTPAAALLFARAACGDESADLQARLAPLPLDLLEIAGDVRENLQAAGLRSLGELLALPADALARRHGPQLVASLQRLTGERADPIPAYRPPGRFRRRLELLGEIGSSEGLLFPLRRLLLELQAYLRARDSGVQEFTLELCHAGATTTPLTIGLAAPACDAAQFLMLLRQRLERLRLPAPVRELRLKAERFAEPPRLQQDLFDPQARREESWRQLSEKLAARLGPEAVGGLAPVADHRPERAWKAVPPGTASTALQFPPRPVWLLAAPQPLPAPPRLRGGAERIESGWWDGAPVRRDYYCAESPQGARWWVYRDLADGRWYLHGLWA